MDRKSDIRPITIAVIDDHPIVRNGLVSVFVEDSAFELVGQGATSAEALQICVEHQPDIILLDLGIPGGGLNALKAIRQQAPKVKCVMLTVCDDAGVAIAAMNSGAKGYILKGVDSRDLISALCLIFRDECFVSPEFAHKLLMATQAEPSPDSASDGLSKREAQILFELEKGSCNRQIAETLSLSENTVKHYVSVIMHKYGATSRFSAVVAVRNLRRANLRESE